MRLFLLLTLLAITAYFYFHNRTAPTPRATAQPASNSPAAPAPILVAATTSNSYQLRWKTGPNAQTNFEPFLPSEQATWNTHTSGYTIIGGAFRRR